MLRHAPFAGGKAAIRKCNLTFRSYEREFYISAMGYQFRRTDRVVNSIRLRNT
jgi:hypothetical protein